MVPIQLTGMFGSGKIWQNGLIKSEKKAQKCMHKHFVLCISTKVWWFQFAKCPFTKFTAFSTHQTFLVYHISCCINYTEASSIFVNTIISQQVSFLLPKKFQVQQIRVYCKKSGLVVAAKGELCYYILYPWTSIHLIILILQVLKMV